METSASTQAPSLYSARCSKKVVRGQREGAVEQLAVVGEPGQVVLRLEHAQDVLAGRLEALRWQLVRADPVLPPGGGAG